MDGQIALPRVSDFLVGNVRKDMNTQGFSLVDTSRFLKDKEWPSQRSKDFKNLNSKRYGRYISLEECSTNWIKNLVQWQERLLKKALPKEKIYRRCEGLSLRNEFFRSEGKGEVCRWHVDGTYIRSICVIKGPTTQIMTDLGESTIPLGWTLFITARSRHTVLNGVPATLHRRPRIKKLRRLILHGWDA